MKLYLTSAIGGSVKENGVRKPGLLLPFNGFTYFLKQDWTENAKVLIITASPSEHERNDSILACLREGFPMSGLSISGLQKISVTLPISPVFHLLFPKLF